MIIDAYCILDETVISQMYGEREWNREGEEKWRRERKTETLKGT